MSPTMDSDASRIRPLESPRVRSSLGLRLLPWWLASWAGFELVAFGQYRAGKLAWEHPVAWLALATCCWAGMFGYWIWTVKSRERLWLADGRLVRERSCFGFNRRDCYDLGRIRELEALPEVDPPLSVQANNNFFGLPSPGISFTYEGEQILLARGASDDEREVFVDALELILASSASPPGRR